MCGAFLAMELEPRTQFGASILMKTVLIVDDEPLIRAYVRDVVEDAGYKAKEAGTADEALRLIEDDGIDIVLSDIEMPGSLDGVELAWTGDPCVGQALAEARPDTYRHAVSGEAVLARQPRRYAFGCGKVTSARVRGNPRA